MMVAIIVGIMLMKSFVVSLLRVKLSSLTLLFSADISFNFREEECWMTIVCRDDDNDNDDSEG